MATQAQRVAVIHHQAVDVAEAAHGDERDFTALVVGQVDEAAPPTQALLPRQHPATTEHAVDGEVAGVEARPFDRHQARQAAAGGEIDRVADGLTVYGFAPLMMAILRRQSPRRKSYARVSNFMTLL
ncbi:hypothetical protein D3C77_316560 [compost metagenome]